MADTHDIFPPIDDRTEGTPDENGCVDGFCPIKKPIDEVNPEHYQSNGIECIDVMKAISTPTQFQGHLWLTAIKYLYRLHAKGVAVVTLRKAIWYLKRLEKELSE